MRVKKESVSLDGARVGLLEGRMGDELSNLIRRHGGVPRLAPAVREQALDQVAGFEELMSAFTREAVDVVVFLTGVGATALFSEAERLGQLPELLARLGRTTNVCRGQKPWKPLKDRGVPISVTVPEPYTTADVLSTLAKLKVEQSGVALLHYGERNEELSRVLSEWGTRLIELSLYEWQLPEDTAPLVEFVEEVISGELDAVAFTSQVQLRHLLEIAAREGRDGELLEALRNRVTVAAVGPTCAAALEACSVMPAVVPLHPKMGPMVIALAEHLKARRASAVAARRAARVRATANREISGEAGITGAAAPRHNGSAAADTRRADPLNGLVEVSRALAGTLDLAAALQAVLAVLEEQHGCLRGVVTLVAPEGDELVIAASRGLPFDTPRPRFRSGEGVTGRVVTSGEPMVVSRVSDEPLFIHRSGARESGVDISYVCTPILVDDEAAGALAVDLPYLPDRDYEATVRLLSVVASMIAQAIKVNRLIEADRQYLVEENSHLREELRERYDFSNIIGSSGPMRHVYTQIAQVAGSNATVLIRGESGTGKELIAHAIHYNSPRAEGQFVGVNCASLPPTLVEAELFGHEKGAFTGAHARKIGLFERADGGTLFLDEIGDLDSALQVKLLRVLQQREVHRVGGIAAVPVDVRIIAATHKNLEDAIASESFREDLYYRLNVFSICVPPLRERMPDVLLLADHFVKRYSAEYGKDVKRISTPAIDMLTSYHWPGNVRELENTIMRAVLVCESHVIHGHHLPPTLQTAAASGTLPTGSLAELVAAYERGLIEDALKSTRGNQAQSAVLLQTTERILGYRVRRYGIDCRRFAR